MRKSEKALAPPDTKNCCAIIITYNPDRLFSERLSRTQEQFNNIIIIDNSTDNNIKEYVSSLAKSTSVHLITNHCNLGVAAALNQGIEHAKKTGHLWVACFDQDSLILDEMLSTISSIYKENGSVKAIIGSNYLSTEKDIKSHSLHHKIKNSRKTFKEVKTVITSGTVIPLCITSHIGRFRDEYFIDSVDHEYCLRARKLGYPIIISHAFIMQHSIGDKKNTLLSQFTSIPSHQPIRKYYIARNAIITIKDYFFHEFLWSIKQVVRLIIELFSILILEEGKKNKALYFLKGIYHGLLGHTGAYQPPSSSCRLPLDLLIIGVHLKSEGYPNVKYKIQDIKSLPNLAIDEINQPMWHKSQQGKHKLTNNIVRSISSHLLVCLKYLRLQRPEQAYIPYPAIFVGLFFSYIPNWMRPKKVIIDAYISLYDTIVIDRKLLPKNSLRAQLLKYIERRSYRFANAIITDTDENSLYLSKLFQLPKNKFINIPLSTNEQDFQLTDYKNPSTNCNVLFIGTLIPLHGINIILDAIKLLEKEKNINFTIIGDGQEGKTVEDFLNKNPLEANWIREWQSSENLAKHIQSADICLGIFGGNKKTQRVCPLKIYAYAACGKAIITLETEWIKNLHNKVNYRAFETIPSSNGEELAKKIKHLASNKKHLDELGKKSLRFYNDNLSNEESNEKLKETFRAGR